MLSHIKGVRTLVTDPPDHLVPLILRQAGFPGPCMIINNTGFRTTGSACSTGFATHRECAFIVSEGTDKAVDPGPSPF